MACLFGNHLLERLEQPLARLREANPAAEPFEKPYFQLRRQTLNQMRKRRLAIMPAHALLRDAAGVHGRAQCLFHFFSESFASMGMPKISAILFWRPRDFRCPLKRRVIVEGLTPSFSARAF